MSCAHVGVPSRTQRAGRFYPRTFSEFRKHSRSTTAAVRPAAAAAVQHRRASHKSVCTGTPDEVSPFQPCDIHGIPSQPHPKGDLVPILYECRRTFTDYQVPGTRCMVGLDNGALSTASTSTLAIYFYWLRHQLRVWHEAYCEKIGFSLI